MRLLLVLLIFTSCKTTAPHSSISETEVKRTALNNAICIDPQMLTLSDSAKATLARYMGPVAASTGVLGKTPLDGKTLEPKVTVLNSCMSGVIGQEVSLKFSFANPYDPATCRCVISSGLAPDAYTPALSCGADKAEAVAPGCMFVRMKGCAESNIKQFLYAPVGKRLSCIRHAQASYPKLDVLDFRDGNTDDLLLAVIDKVQLKSKCQAAVITKQQWETFVERRPGFVKNAEIFGSADIPGNIISCADPEDVKWMQSKAFAGDGIDHPCFASARSGFGSCTTSSALAKAVRNNPKGDEQTKNDFGGGEDTTPTPSEDTESSQTD